MDTMLTTIDNPHSPFDDFDRWYFWDASHGYHTSGLLARITQMSPDISETDQDLSIALAMEEIVQENVSGMHRLVTRADFPVKTKK